MTSERAETLWERWSREPGVHWMGLSTGLACWFSVAWVDARFLAGIPLAGAVTAAIYRWRPPRRDSPDELVL